MPLDIIYLCLVRKTDHLITPLHEPSALGHGKATSRRHDRVEAFVALPQPSGTNGTSCRGPSGRSTSFVRPGRWSPVRSRRARRVKRPEDVTGGRLWCCRMKIFEAIGIDWDRWTHPFGSMWGSIKIRSIWGRQKPGRLDPGVCLGSRGPGWCPATSPTQTDFDSVKTTPNDLPPLETRPPPPVRFASA